MVPSEIFGANEQVGENGIIRSFIICTRQTLWLSNKTDGRGKQLMELVSTYIRTFIRE
jgi:hypothetical protein